MAKRKKSAAGDRRLRQGMFQNTPWRPTEVDELFTGNKSFRTLALTASRQLARAGNLPSPDLDDAKALAQQMASISEQIGRKLAVQQRVGGKVETTYRYPHPSLLLLSLLKLGAKNNIIADTGVGREGPVRLNDEIVDAFAAMLHGYRAQGNLARGWIELTRAAGITDQPFFLRHKLHDVRTHDGEVNGFRLSKVWLRIPTRNVLKTDAKGQIDVQPEGYTVIEVDLLSADAAQQFGEVWMGVANDGRGLYLASKKGTGQSIVDLLKLGRKSSTQGSKPLYPPKGTKAQLPRTLIERLRAGAARLRGKAPVRITERVDAIA